MQKSTYQDSRFSKSGQFSELRRHSDGKVNLRNYDKGIRNISNSVSSPTDQEVSSKGTVMSVKGMHNKNESL